MKAIEKAVDIIGTQTNVADILGVKQASVWNWIHRGRLPAKHIRSVAKATNHKVSVNELLKDHENNN
ncbi:transcriptional regulator [Psychromonas sp. psych-6C06]|uniref:YdaS family helix-turn-helix protein n=1 Tax=Psychromonas sp. psych-6C06 TaxID=2058089 RepID=UPI000C3449D3|nr:YdaS family helix-turn-helix protein [Psychromonas sp. psych-6C06]PKF60639.1 transcriptional regulator [Psychromonas sp. psych-6C06]